MKTAYDAMREDRKDYKVIANATAGSLTLTQDDFDLGKNGLAYDLTGAGLTTINLPVAKVGYRIVARISGAGGVKFVPGSGDALSNGSGKGTADKYLTSTTVGGFIILDCQREDVWDCLAATGTWTFQS